MAFVSDGLFPFLRKGRPSFDISSTAPTLTTSIELLPHKRGHNGLAGFYLRWEYFIIYTSDEEYMERHNRSCILPYVWIAKGMKTSGATWVDEDSNNGGLRGKS